MGQLWSTFPYKPDIRGRRAIRRVTENRGAPGAGPAGPGRASATGRARTGQGAQRIRWSASVAGQSGADRRTRSRDWRRAVGGIGDHESSRGVAMGFYEDRVLPRFIDLALGQ